MAEGVCHGTLKCSAGFNGVGLAPRCEQTLFLPDVATHGGKGVAERRSSFAIPGCRRHATPLGRLKLIREQGHDREQPEQARRGLGDGQVRPITLGLGIEGALVAWAGSTSSAATLWTRRGG